MNVFLKRILLFSSFLLCVSLGSIILTGTIAQKRLILEVGKDKKKLVLGHSYPECAYNDQFIEATVNVARSRESYFFTYLKVKALLTKNSNIESIFLEFADNSISKSMDAWIFSDLEMDSNVIKYACLMSWDEAWVLFSNNPLSLIASVPLILKQNMGYIKNKENLIDDFGGYKLLSHELQPSQIPIAGSPLSGDISLLNLKYLDKIIELCSQSNVNLFFVKTPVHERSARHPKFNLVLNQRYSNIKMLDFSAFELNDSEMADLGHLNSKGATRFSRMVGDLFQTTSFQQSVIDSLVVHYNSID